MTNEKTKSTTRVVPIVAALLRDVDAARYLGRSVSWIRGLRLADAKARREGRPTTGPTWHVIGKSIFYKPADLDDWIASNSVQNGTVAFSNRGGGAE